MGKRSSRTFSGSLPPPQPTTQHDFQQSNSKQSRGRCMKQLDLTCDVLAASVPCPHCRSGKPLRQQASPQSSLPPVAASDAFRPRSFPPARCSRDTVCPFHICNCIKTCKFLKGRFLAQSKNNCKSNGNNLARLLFAFPVPICSFLFITA